MKDIAEILAQLSMRAVLLDHLENIFRSVGWGIVILNQEGDYTYASDKWREWLGFDLVGRNVYEVLHSDDVGAVSDAISTGSPGHTLYFFCRYVGNNGVIHLQWDASAGSESSSSMYGLARKVDHAYFQRKCGGKAGWV